MSSLREQLKLYRELSKSGIVALVLISVLGGYLIGHSPEAPFSLSRLALTLLGILLLASGSSALNQWQERHIDAEMPRTAKRPIPSGRLKPGTVLVFVVVTLAAGLAILAILSVALVLYGLLAVFSYNVLYTLWWKRRWAYAAVPGAIPGALPILMGHASASGQALSPAGAYLFFILYFWQMPHFWVLALRFREDYAQGGFPTLPVTRGKETTLYQITLWCLAYVALALIAPLFLRVGPLYVIAAVSISLKLLWELRAFSRQPESKRWLSFFLWVNFSLVILIAAAALDVWRMSLMMPIWTR